tara:strand:+ start:127 stop:2286 length:2160 start_codon:yes stop_codon:yes gene_type:complete
MSSLDNDLKAASEKLMKKQLAVSDVGMASGVTSAGLQGLTLGFSDEIGAGIGAGVESLFSDKSFGDIFDTRVAESRNRLESFKKAKPKAALASEIGGSVLPVAISLLAAPFSGGTSTAGTIAATTTRILSNPLLAGKIAKPGSGLLQQSFEAGKIGLLQGVTSGVGYSDGGSEDKTVGGIIGGVAGGAIGAAVPPVLTGGAKVVGAGYNAIKNVVAKKPMFTPDEKKSIKIVSDQFARDDISVEEVVKKIQANVSADKLEGLSPVEILADYGGDAVLRKLRGINTRVPGMNIGKKLSERTGGTMESKTEALLAGQEPNIQSFRIGRAIETGSKKAIKTEGFNLESGIDDIVDSVSKRLAPLYDLAYAKNTSIGNIEVYRALNESPVLKNAYTQAIKLFNDKRIAKGLGEIKIPPLKKLLLKDKGNIVGINQTLPLEFLDMVKRVADTNTYKKVRDGTIDKQMAGPRRQIANNFREKLKQSVKGDEYVSVLSEAADNFSLKEAYDFGSQFGKSSATAKAFNSQFSKFKSNSEKDAFRVGVFQEIMSSINKVSDNQDLVKKIFSSPDLRQKVSILFGDNKIAMKNYTDKLVREADILRTSQTVSGGSNTAEKLFDADQVAQTASDLAVAGSGNITDAAGIRAISSLMTKGRDIISNPLERTSRSVGNILLEQNPNKQMEILKLMQQLEKTGKVKNSLMNIAGGSGIRYASQQPPQLLKEPQ